jgi:hypothetical protein
MPTFQEFNFSDDSVFTCLRFSVVINHHVRRFRNNGILESTHYVLDIRPSPRKAMLCLLQHTNVKFKIKPLRSGRLKCVTEAENAVEIVESMLVAIIKSEGRARL